MFVSKLFDINGFASALLMELFNLAAERPENAHITKVHEFLQKLCFPKGHVERWEYLDPDLPSPQVLRILRDLGMVDEVGIGVVSNFSSIHPLGALHPRVITRLGSLRSLLNMGIRCERIIMLGADRELQKTDPKDPTILGRECDSILRSSPPELPTRAHWTWDKPMPTTEAENMAFQWGRADLPPKALLIPNSVVSAPYKMEGGKRVRANTYDTIEYLIQKYSPHGNLLFISNQPHVGYQDAVIRRAFTGVQNVNIRTIGVAASPTLRTQFYMGELARWVSEEYAMFQEYQRKIL